MITLQGEGDDDRLGCRLYWNFRWHIIYLSLTSSSKSYYWLITVNQSIRYTSLVLANDLAEVNEAAYCLALALSISSFFFLLSSWERYKPMLPIPMKKRKPPAKRKTIPEIHIALGSCGEEPQTIRTKPNVKTKPAVQQQNKPKLKYLLGVFLVK